MIEETALVTIPPPPAWIDPFDTVLGPEYLDPGGRGTEVTALYSVSVVDSSIFTSR